MKVIFLDINGVLNNYQTFIDVHFEFVLTGFTKPTIDSEKVELLKQIVDSTEAKIVLIADTRKQGKMKNGLLVTKNQELNSLINILNNYGLSIYDITPKGLINNREREIRSWLKNKDVESFIIIEDESIDLPSFSERELVKTNFKKIDSNGDGIKELSGLTMDHVNEAINKLNNNKVLVKS